MNNIYELNYNNFQSYEIIYNDNYTNSEIEFAMYFIKLTIFLKNGNKLIYDISSFSNIQEEIQPLFNKIKKDKNYKLTIIENLKKDKDNEDSFIEIKDNNNIYKYNTFINEQL